MLELGGKRVQYYYPPFVSKEFNVVCVSIVAFPDKKFSKMPRRGESARNKVIKEKRNGCERKYVKEERKMNENDKRKK